MSTTLLELRQALGLELEECVTGQVQASTATTLVDTALAEARPATGAFVGAWVLISSGAQAGTVRRVTGYDATTGTLTVARAWTAPAAGSAYEVHTLASPADLLRFINAGLARCPYLREEEIAAVAGQRQYSLAAYTWLLRPSQVVDVRWRLGDVGQQVTYPARWFDVRVTAGEGETPSLTLHVDPLSSATTLVLQAIAYYGPLAADTDTTGCDARWALAAAAVQAWAWLTRSGPAQDVQRYERRQAEAAARFRALSRQLAPRPTRRLMMPEAGGGRVTWGA